MRIHTLRWTKKRLWVLDQTLLPARERWIALRTRQAVWEAIRSLRVRGAPLIGVVAAFGVVVAAQRHKRKALPAARRGISADIRYLAGSRPTAVNLFWALERMGQAAEAHCSGTPALMRALEGEAKKIYAEDLDAGRRIGDWGAPLLRGKRHVLTHCNAGGLATSGYGTALAPVYRAREKGRKLHVYVDETRPLLQGARLTAWELMKARIPMTLICDNMAGTVLAKESVDAVLVGADRIAGNGDAANKIGTYPLAVLAHRHGVPFYVAAPLSTIDRALSSGKQIPIEQREAGEITHGFGKRTAPKKVRTFSPAFDVTPHRLIRAIITETGVLRPPYNRSIRAAFAKAKRK